MKTKTNIKSLVLSKKPTINLVEKLAKKTTVIREATDSDNMWNGGDYSQWEVTADYWTAEYNSADFNNSDIEYVGGSLFNVPVIVSLDRDVNIEFADSSKIALSYDEWSDVATHWNWKRVLSSDIGIRFNVKR